MAPHGVRDFIRGVLDLVFPNACLICDAPASDDDILRHGLCSNCWAAVTNEPHNLCMRCGQTTGPHADSTDGCVACRSVSFGFRSVIRMGPYEGRLRDAILRMKQSSGQSLAENMGR